MGDHHCEAQCVTEEPSMVDNDVMQVFVKTNGSKTIM